MPPTMKRITMFPCSLASGEFYFLHQNLNQAEGPGSSYKIGIELRQSERICNNRLVETEFESVSLLTTRAMTSL